MQPFLSMLSIAALGYLAVCGLPFFAQRSQIYFPVPESMASGAEALEIESAGVTLKVWALRREGSKADKSGEVVKVVVVGNAQAPTAQELIAFCRERLTGYKVPKRVDFVAELPKTGVGKVKRRLLRAPRHQIEGLTRI
jgi:acyl-CoA synthetase (AMP-forming)/AMP-acid ligase II